MKTLRTVYIKPVYIDIIPEHSDMVDGEVYISNMYETSSHRCLCGCGILVVTPLIDGWWVIESGKNDTISVTPSILNSNLRCKSHYIITSNIANFV